MNVKSRRYLGLLVAILFSAGLLYWLIRDLNFSEVANELSQMNYIYTIPWFLIFILGNYLRAIRWSFLLNGREDIKIPDLFHALSIGNLGTMFLPFRAGEFLRPFYFCKWSNKNFAEVFASVVIERIFDVIGLLFVFSLYFYKIPNLPNSIFLGSISLIILCGILIAFMFLCYLVPTLPVVIETLLLKVRIPKKLVTNVSYVISKFITGVSSIKSLKQLAIIIVLSFSIWFSYVASSYIVLFSLAPDTATLSSAAITCVFIALLIAAPSAPGFIATFQLGCVLSLTDIFSYSKEFSIAYSIISQGGQYLGTIILGIIALSFRGVSFSKLVKQDS